MPRTSPASVCVVSVADFDRNLAFYRDVLGLDASPELLLAGDAFTGQWRLPAGSTARSALLAHPASAVGRILLVQFDRPGENVRGKPQRTRHAGVRSHQLRRSASQMELKPRTRVASV